MQPQLDKNIPDRCLQEIFCERFKCPPNKFEEKLFWMCVRPNVLWIAKICWIFYRRMFATDLEMLRQLGRTSTTRELRFELESFRHYHPPRGFLRRELKVRVSGRRLLKVASRLFGIEAARKARSLKTGTSLFETNQPPSASNTSQTSPETIAAPVSQTSDTSSTTENPKN